MALWSLDITAMCWPRVVSAAERVGLNWLPQRTNFFMHVRVTGPGGVWLWGHSACSWQHTMTLLCSALCPC